VVIATDGVTTHVLFLYQDIQWATPSTFVGFSAGDNVNEFYLPGTSTAAEILNLESMSNVGVPGMFAFRVDQSSIILPGDHS